MAKLTEQIRADLTESMKARDAERTSTLRMLQSAFKYAQIEAGHELADDEALVVLRKAVKQRQDSIEQFTKGNRPELAEKETKELAIIESYLPAGASGAEMEAAITKAISESGANSIKQMGAVVKAAKGALEGKTVDGKALSDLVRERLSKLG